MDSENRRTREKRALNQIPNRLSIWRGIEVYSSVPDTIRVECSDQVPPRLFLFPLSQGVFPLCLMANRIGNSSKIYGFFSLNSTVPSKCSLSFTFFDLLTFSCIYLFVSCTWLSREIAYPFDLKVNKVVLTAWYIISIKWRTFSIRDPESFWLSTWDSCRQIGPDESEDKGGRWSEW